MNIFKINIPKSILILIILAFFLNVFRVIIFNRFSFVYIFWNIFLAFIPFLISSILLYYQNIKKLKKCFFIIGGIFWLIFLPNAPYIVTDLMHIGVVSGVPVIYDSILLFTSAWVGLLFGLFSLSHMERIIKLRYSKEIVSISMIIIIFLASFGMYLGRFLRFNSWDIFTNPLYFFSKLLESLFQSAVHIEALLYTILFFCFIYVSYLSWKYSQKQND